MFDIFQNGSPVNGVSLRQLKILFKFDQLQCSTHGIRFWFGGQKVTHIERLIGGGIFLSQTLLQFLRIFILSGVIHVLDLLISLIILLRNLLLHLR